MALVEINWNPTNRQLRVFGAVSLAILVGLGALAFGRHRVAGFAVEPGTATAAAWVLWSLAGAGAIAWLVWPQAWKPIFIGLTLLTLPIGIVVSYTMLAVVYFGLITPLALFFRLRGRDPLARRFDPAAPTYWVRRPPMPDAERYFRQY